MTRIIKNIFRFILVVYVFFMAYEWALPPSPALQSPSEVYFVPEESVHFYADETFIDKSGKRVVKQEIWDKVFEVLSGAHRMIFLDMFLFNDFQGPVPETTRPLAQELTDVLVAKRETNPHVPITFITDPINTVYGGVKSPYLDRLRTKGVYLVTTDLSVLPDSNLLYSAFWRPFVRVFDNSTQGGWLPHPFQAGGEKVTLRSWATLLNFKANHRKVLVADEPIIKKGMTVGSAMVTIVTSSNPHDGSSAHGNIALKVDGQVWRDVLRNESAIAKLSGAGLATFDSLVEAEATGTLRVTYLHDKEIKDKALSVISDTKKGDSIDLEMFYLSERDIIQALLDAANRGVTIRVILDPNNDAFGHKKNGIPNRPVAKELVSASGGDIQVRWCDTHGEQCHAKLFMGKTASSTFLMVGSANFTRRNINGYNLEADIFVEQRHEFPAWKDASSYYAKLWSNTGETYTTAYETYQDTTIWKSSLYRMMERTGLSSF